jgi:hypothetical protein
MREVAFASPPDERAYPGEGRKNHVHNKTQHKDLKRTVLITQMNKEDAEQAIGKTENGPRNEAGSQQIPRRAEETEYGRSGKQTEKRGAGKIALASKSFKERNAIGDKNPNA